VLKMESTIEEYGIEWNKRNSSVCNVRSISGIAADFVRRTEMRQAVMYTRVSSKDQEREGYSIPAQQALLHEYAAKHGFKIVREFVDVETAKVAGRKEFGNMVAFL
jgi:predicted site-specific integrase-resolvase